MLDLSSPEVQFAVCAVHQAAQIIQQVQLEMVTPSLTKGDRSPVTVADFACQALVGYLLSQSYPDVPLVAEEDSGVLRDPQGAAVLQAVTSFVERFLPQTTPEAVCNWIDHNRADTAPRFWTLDPIDGTKGFLRGDQYVVALALVVDGQVQLGALGCPNLTDAFRPDLEGPGSLVIAARGQGTWVAPLVDPRDFTPLKVSARANPADARIFRSYEAGHTNVDQIEHFAEKMAVRAEPLRMDSQAKYAVLAAGKGDILLRLISPSRPDYREMIWDQAAGSIVLEEAGGRISDLDGKVLDFSTGRTLAHNRGILASNSLLHPVALNALKALGA